MTAFRYSAPLIIPDTSDAKDKIIQQEIAYIFNALRTLAAHLDKVTGALSPVEADWPSTSPVVSMLGTNINKFYCQCSANIGYGAMVNFHNVSPTTVKARPARADVYTNAAGGFCNTPGGFAAGEWGEFIVGPGINSGIGGMTPGNWYFLDPVSVTGQITATAPSAAGQIYQNCGIAIKDNMLLVGAFNNWLII